MARPLRLEIEVLLLNNESLTLDPFLVKRRQTEKKEGIRHVREFIGAIANSPFNEGFYVTTAPDFTGYALKELNESEINLLGKNIKISLVDGSRLRSLLELHKPADRCISVFNKIAPVSGWNSVALECKQSHITDVFSETRQIKPR
jgi:hypothetical protein